MNANQDDDNVLAPTKVRCKLFNASFIQFNEEINSGLAKVKYRDTWKSLNGGVGATSSEKDSNLTLAKVKPHELTGV